MLLLICLLFSPPTEPLNLREFVDPGTTGIIWDDPKDWGESQDDTYGFFVYLNGKLFSICPQGLHQEFFYLPRGVYWFWVTAYNAEGEGPPSNTLWLKVR